MGSVKAANMDGQEMSGICENVEFYPWVHSGSEWYPICGHDFWDGHEGADTICRALGFELGHIVRDVLHRPIQSKLTKRGCL